MAPTLTIREKLLKEAKGLSFLRTGEIPKDGAFDPYTDTQLRRQIKEYRTAINQNWELDTLPEEQDIDAPVSLAGQTPLKPVYTKDKLIGFIDTELTADTALPADEALSVKSAMSVAGYTVDLDSETFSKEEESALGRFRTNIDKLSLEQIANSNFVANAENAARAAIKAEAEQAAAVDKAELKGSVASMLVYGGYLAPEDASNNKRIASALNLVITLKTPVEDQVAVQQSLFEDFENWELSGPAAAYVRNNITVLNPKDADHTTDMLRSHLESGNPELIALAQGYLAAQPGNDDVRITGELDPTTYDAGVEQLRKPLALPSEIFNADGSLMESKLKQLAVDGQLYLPMDNLSAEDRALVDSLPWAKDREAGDVNCKERLLAQILIVDDPEGYKKLLAEENAARAGATLDAKMIQLPVVAVPATATIVEEQLDIASNPAGLFDNPEGDAMYDASQPIVDGIKEDGIGVTDRSDFVVFENQPVALSGIVEAIKLDKGAFGDGEADNLIGMEGAINLVRGAISAKDIHLTGISIPLIPDQIAAINESLGYDQFHKFDVTNPHEMQALLNGVITHQNLTSAGVPFTPDLIAEYSTIDRPDVKKSVGIASGVIAVEPSVTPSKPATDKPVEMSALTGKFGVEAGYIMPKPLAADNTDSEPVLVASLNGPAGMR